MTDLRRLAEAAIQAEASGGHFAPYDEAAHPRVILQLLDVVEAARAAMESNEGDAMAFFGKLADLRTALQALDSSAIRDMKEGGS